jgi:DNA primase
MPCLFVRDLVSKDADTLLIVAGELDCLVAWQYGLEAVSGPSGVADLRWIGEEWDFLKRFKRLLLAFDGDEAGSISRVAPCRPGAFVTSGVSPVLRCLLALPH